MTICINDDKLLNNVPKIIPIINKKNKFVFSLLNIILNSSNEKIIINPPAIKKFKFDPIKATFNDPKEKTINV